MLKEPFKGETRKDRLIINGKILLPASEIEGTINGFYKATKGDGARKLQYRMREYYYGIGEKVIQKRLNELEQQRKRRPRFENKAPLRPIHAKEIMDRHQIDLVDMKSLLVKEGAKTYRYILSILDAFSRYVWLRALQDKTTEAVSRKLYQIYNDFGTPRIIQCDQGSEFKGTVKTLCKQMNIKLIYSSSNHPQSQGKIERSHSTWKDKIRYDLMATTEGGFCNWHQKLPALQICNIYNEAMHSSIGMSPYECHFGKKSNNMRPDNRLHDTFHERNDNILNEKVSLERLENDARRHLEITTLIRNKARLISEKNSSKMKQRHLTKMPPSEYHVNDEVLVKFTGKDRRLSRGGSTITAPKVLEGKVVEADAKNFRYKVQTKNEKGQLFLKWYRVNEITSKKFNDEIGKQTAAKIKFQKPKSNTNQKVQSAQRKRLVTDEKSIFKQKINKRAIYIKRIPSSV